VKGVLDRQDQIAPKGDTVHQSNAFSIQTGAALMNDRDAMSKSRAVIVRAGTRFCNALFALFMLMCVCTIAPASAQDGSYLADSVKAAYLYHFAGYVDWPAETGEAPLLIGVIGDRGVAAELQRILPGRSIQGRAMQVRELNLSDSLAGVSIVYVGSRNGVDLPQMVNATRQRHILLVSDEPGGLEMGSTINFVNVANRIRFEISLRAAEAAELKISSRLLSAALKLKRSHWNPYDKSGGQWLIALHPAATSSLVPTFFSRPLG
jgi:YfiR/HmsC-like